MSDPIERGLKSDMEAGAVEARGGWGSELGVFGLCRAGVKAM